MNLKGHFQGFSPATVIACAGAGPAGPAARRTPEMDFAAGAGLFWRAL